MQDVRAIQYFRFVGCCAVVGLLLICTLEHSALAQPTVSVRTNVGAAFFRAPEVSSELLNSGINFGVEGDLFVYRGFSVTLSGGYAKFTLNEENARLYNLRTGDLSVLNGALGLRYTYANESDAHPYVTAGFGLYRLRSTNVRDVQDGELVNTQEEGTALDEGVHLAAGSSFRIDDTYAVFFEPRYVFYDVGRRLTGTVRYLTLRLGLLAQW